MRVKWGNGDPWVMVLWASSTPLEVRVQGSPRDVWVIFIEARLSSGGVRSGSLFQVFCSLQRMLWVDLKVYLIRQIQSIFWAWLPEHVIKLFL